MVVNDRVLLSAFSDDGLFIFLIDCQFSIFLSNTVLLMIVFMAVTGSLLFRFLLIGVFLDFSVIEFS